MRMRLRLWSSLGISLIIAVASPVWANQTPSAFVPDNAYRISPHQPTTEELTGEGLSFSPHKPAGIPFEKNERPDVVQTAPSTNANPLPSPTFQPTQNAPKSASPEKQVQNQTEVWRANEDARRSEKRHRHDPRPFVANMQVSPMMGLGAACVNSSVTICGKKVPVQAGPIGAIVNMTVPFPYVPQTFTTQCLAVGGIPAYRIVDATQVNCELQTCAPSEVSLCGAKVDILSATKVGNLLKLQVPPSILSNPGSNYVPTLQVRCAEGQNGIAAYFIENEIEISCNQFPCQTSNVRLCDTAVEVPGGSPLGTVLTLTMPPPFQPDQFAVQCLGTMGRQPVYQIVDHEYVSCNRLN